MAPITPIAKHLNAIQSPTRRSVSNSGHKSPRPDFTISASLPTGTATPAIPDSQQVSHLPVFSNPQFDHELQLHNLKISQAFGDQPHLLPRHTTNSNSIDSSKQFHSQSINALSNIGKYVIKTKSEVAIHNQIVTVTINQTIQVMISLQIQVNYSFLLLPPQQQ